MLSNAEKSNELRWSLVQKLGEESEQERDGKVSELNDEEILSISSNKRGDMVGVGDRQGRIVIFSKEESKQLEYELEF